MLALPVIILTRAWVNSCTSTSSSPSSSFTPPPQTLTSLLCRSRGSCPLFNTRDSALSPQHVICINTTLIDTSSKFSIHRLRSIRHPSPVSSFRQRFFAAVDIPFHACSACPTTTFKNDLFRGHRGWPRDLANEEQSDLRPSAESVVPLSDLQSALSAARANHSADYEGPEQDWLLELADVASEPDWTPHCVPMRAAKMAIENIPFVFDTEAEEGGRDNG